MAEISHLHIALHLLKLIQVSRSEVKAGDEIFTLIHPVFLVIRCLAQGSVALSHILGSPEHLFHQLVNTLVYRNFLCLRERESLIPATILLICTIIIAWNFKLLIIYLFHQPHLELVSVTLENTFRLSIHCFSTITNCRHTLMKGSYPHWRDNRVPYASQWPFQYCQLLSPGSYMTARTLAIATIFLWLAACCGATLPDIRFSSLGIAFHRLGGGSGATPREENRLKKAIPPVFLAKNYPVISS